MQFFTTTVATPHLKSASLNDHFIKAINRRFTKTNQFHKGKRCDGLHKILLSTESLNMVSWTRARSGAKQNTVLKSCIFSRRQRILNLLPGIFNF
jgi:hypothetical protein